MKPIIVTYSNDSYITTSNKIIRGGIGYMVYELPYGGFYFCKHIISNKQETIWVSDIKLIARPKKQNNMGSICDCNKIIYDSKSEAQAAAAGIWDEDKVKLNSYKCPEGNGFHLTTAKIYHMGYKA